MIYCLNVFDRATLINMSGNDKLELLALLEIDDNVLLKLLTKNRKCASNDMKSLLKLIRNNSNYEGKKKVKNQ